MNRSQAVALIEFNAWANRRVFARASRLPAQTLSATSSLMDRPPLATLVHILDTQWYWREGAQSGRLPVEALEPADFRTLSSLRRRWDEEDRLLLAYASGLSDRALRQAVTYSWPRARPRSAPRWQILVHIVNHATQHRSELAMFLTARRLSPGNLDFLRFVRLRERSRS